jgi:hypothetical protein
MIPPHSSVEELRYDSLLMQYINLRIKMTTITPESYELMEDNECVFRQYYGHQAKDLAGFFGCNEMISKPAELLNEIGLGGYALYQSLWDGTHTIWRSDDVFLHIDDNLKIRRTP